MADDEELKARIAALSNQINQHKQHQSHHNHPTRSSYTSHFQQDGRARWQPYHVQRGAYSTSFRNRTLQVNHGTAAQSAQNRTETSYVKTGNKLMTKAAYSREQESRKERHDDTVTLRKSLDSTRNPPPASRELSICDLTFKVQDDGRKLVRCTGNDLKETPKKIQVSGIDFYRTKKGNLARANLATNRLREIHAQQCETFTKHGTCPYGPSCKYAHDPKKIAICKDFLHTGTCRAGSYCDLSHEPTYHRAPACTHFLRGNCTNATCRYPHVNVSASAPVCRAFATLGYCAKGPECCRRHVTECPDYANKGHCPALLNGKCSLPHIDRASALRKAAKRQEKTGSEGESDLSSDEDEEVHKKSHNDVEMEDLDSDEIEEDMLAASTINTHDLTEQKDFVLL